MIAEAAGELGLEARRIELEQAARELGALGPDDRRAMLAALAVAHRQDGEGPAGQELLLGDAAMRPFVARHQHDRDLVVRPGARADAGLLAHRAEAAFGRRDEPRGEAPAALQRELGLVRRRGWSRSPRRARPARPAGRPPVVAAWPRAGSGSRRSSPSARRLAAVGGGFAMIEMQEQRARPGRRGRRRRCGCRGSARPRPPARPTRPAPRTGAGWYRRWPWCGRRSRPRSGT